MPVMPGTPITPYIDFHSFHSRTKSKRRTIAGTRPNCCCITRCVCLACRWGRDGSHTCPLQVGYKVCGGAWPGPPPRLTVAV